MNEQLVSITVDVTAEDIAKGIRGKCEWCPISLAISRVLKSDVDIKTYSRYITIVVDSDSCANKISLPFEARRFVTAFDTAAVVEPFKFKLLVQKYYVNENDDS